jgi:acyl dehydratase
MFPSLRALRQREVVNYGLDKVRFPTPVPAGSWLRLSASIAEVTTVGHAVQAVIDAVIELENADKPACVAQPVFRYYP